MTDAPATTVYQENLLALDVTVETRRLAQRCEEYRLEVAPGDFRLIHIDDFRAMDRLTHAILLQGAERLVTATPESDCSRTFEVKKDAFLVLAVVRPNDPGPIRLTAGGFTLVDAFGRAAFLQGWSLLPPGVMCEREPANAILLGRRLTPTEAIMYFGTHAYPCAWTTRMSPATAGARVAETQPEETGDTK